MSESGQLRHGNPEVVGMDPARIELIRERARGWVAAGDMPSLVLLVARKGVIVLEEAYGILRPSDNAQLQTDSIFPVMSISKSFTAAAVMCLVEDGLLSLKHPITDLLPEIAAPGADQVLVADLLTHTSGYDDTIVFAQIASRIERQSACADAAPGQHPLTNRLIRFGADAPLTRAPGEVASYCNFGYLLLGDIVRRVSGEPLSRFTESRIFEPLGMNDSTFKLGPIARARRVLRDPTYPDLSVLFPPGIFPAVDSEELDAWDSGIGGATSTARDIAVFGKTLLNGGSYDGRRVLSRASVAAMTAPQLPSGIRAAFSIRDPETGALTDVPIRGGNVGYGLIMVPRDDRLAHMNGSLASPLTFAHSGALGSMFWADPQADVVGVYLSVMPKTLANGSPYFWRFDHFQDMVHAAIVD